MTITCPSVLVPPSTLPSDLPSKPCICTAKVSQVYKSLSHLRDAKLTWISLGEPGTAQLPLLSGEHGDNLRDNVDKLLEKRQG